jgi:predicted metal-dependent HD superfamily phosphohydrolase
MLDLSRWATLCDRLGLGHAASRFAILSTAYAEPHRRYHDAAHIVECLAHLDDARHLAARPDEVELALWLHDVVYRPLRSGNEARSAKLAGWWLRAAVAPEEVVQRVQGLILCTTHREAPAGEDQALVQDIDLAILGAGPERFAEYERQIRQEYRWVPGKLFRRRRAELLRSFLARDALYGTAWFRERFETAARRNLEGALRRLSGTGEG